MGMLNNRLFSSFFLEKPFPIYVKNVPVTESRDLLTNKIRIKGLHPTRISV